MVMTTLLDQLNADMASIIEKVAPSLVVVHSGRGGNGAGTIWHPDGLIVTNAHVLRGRSMEVTLADGRRLPAKVLAYDAAHDLAALMVEATGLPIVELGDSRQLQPGQWVLALGHPWGIRGAVSAGVIIGMGAEWPGLEEAGRELLAVNLPLRPGNSGGPLVDAQGRLLGINAMMTGAEVGMAVPVHVAKAILRQHLVPQQAAA